MSSLFAAIFCIICTTRLSALIPTANKAQQIITATFNGNGDTKYVVNDEALNMLTTTDGPYRIISVIGQARKGKSTTLNSVISELAGNNILPFQTSGGLDPCTQGMWMYVLPKCGCVNEDTGYCYTNCVKGNYSYIFLDIEGSDTSKDDVAIRYAAIATLLSSKVFLLIHESLFAHDIDHVKHIDTFVKAMNAQNMNVPFDDIDLGIIIREPLGKLVKGKLEEKINEFFQEFSGIKLETNSDLLSKKLEVKAIENYKHQYYDSSIKRLSKYIANEENFKYPSNKINFELLSGSKIIEFILNMVDEINSNEDLNAICIGCVFSVIVQWNEWGEFSECSQNCTENHSVGFKTKRRTCNTGRDRDCEHYRHGVTHEEEECNKYSCDDLKWTEWFVSECTVKCGGGTQKRMRECKTGQKNDCIKYVGGDDSDTIDCNKYSCNDLKWTNWIISGECTKPCGGGTQTRTRECQTGQKDDCIKYIGGDGSETIDCNKYSCDDLKWTDWIISGECTEPCGGGIQIRTRQCQTGQKNDCVKYIGGNDEDIIDCNIHSCYNFFCRAGGVFC